MITSLDHIVVLLEDVKAGVAAYETLLGRAPSWRNSGDGVERVLFTLDNMSLASWSTRVSEASRIPRLACCGI